MRTLQATISACCLLGCGTPSPDADGDLSATAGTGGNTAGGGTPGDTAGGGDTTGGSDTAGGGGSDTAGGGDTAGSDTGGDEGDSDLPSLACNTWAEGEDAADDGATRDYYNRGVRLRWRNFMGDWVDAKGTDQGDTPYAVTTLDDNNTPEMSEWGVTELVQRWVDGQDANRGFLLRSLSGDGPFRFRSREWSVEEEQPSLVVETAEGMSILAPVADTYLVESTFQASGEATELTLGQTSPVLLRFDLSDFEPRSVISATLRMFKFEDFGGSSMDGGVFQAAPGPTGPLPPIEAGLAQAYPGDVDIGSDPGVYLYSDFESANWADVWSASGGTVDIVDVDRAGGFEPLSGQALRVTVPVGENLGLSLRYRFADEIGDEPEAIYMRYYLRFADDWWPSDGGKLPGIAGTYGVAGWGGRPVDGTDGWSARGTNRAPAPLSNPFGGFSAIGNYVYHADMQGQYGDVELYQDACGGVLDRSRWYAVEQYLQMNTPGQNDGILRAWVDGRLVHEKTDWRWRDILDLRIEEVWMNIYHGGTATPPADIHLYIDNVVIAQAYIGPMGD